jgi:hypothetical protein
MLTSEQLLFTVVFFGHVLIAGITLLIAVTLDDPHSGRSLAVQRFGLTLPPMLLARAEVE